MSIALFMKPKTPPVKWEDFLSSYPSYSIAIDGFVTGPPAFSRSGPHINFNHHEGVSRLETRATCAQVFMAIKKGLLVFFTNESGVTPHVYGNHCDEDTCFSFALLKYGHIPEFINSPNLASLVTAADLLDTTGASYPFSVDDIILQEIAWVFAPYYEFRLNGGTERKEGEEFIQVAEEVSIRILNYSAGRGKSLPLDLSYKKESGGPGWFFIELTGAQARIAMANDGIDAFVTKREGLNGSWTYTVERSSKFIPFDVSRILATLNKVEGRDENHKDRWGGADDRGGSPRVSGSFLSPEEVAKVINNLV